MSRKSKRTRKKVGPQGKPEIGSCEAKAEGLTSTSDGTGRRLGPKREWSRTKKPEVLRETAEITCTRTERTRPADRQQTILAKERSRGDCKRVEVCTEKTKQRRRGEKIEGCTERRREKLRGEGVDVPNTAEHHRKRQGSNRGKVGKPRRETADNMATKATVGYRATEAEKSSGDTEDRWRATPKNAEAALKRSETPGGREGTKDLWREPSSEKGSGRGLGERVREKGLGAER